MKGRWPRATYIEDSARTAVDRQAHFRSGAMAGRAAAARRADRHRFRSAGVGRALANPDGQARRPIPTSPPRYRARRPRAPSAPRSARTRCRSWCRAIASSANPATSPAITGASPASARCWAGKRARSERRRRSSDGFPDAAQHEVVHRWSGIVSSSEFERSRVCSAAFHAALRPGNAYRGVDDTRRSEIPLRRYPTER